MAEAYWLEAFVGQTVVRLVDGKESTVQTSSLRGKHIGLYFSAHWCPPCRGFTPTLSSLYKQMNQEGKDIEIIFVSSDNKKAEWMEYFASMPWAAVPFESQQLSRALSHKHGIMGIPSLVIYSPEGALLTKDAVSGVRGGAAFPWTAGGGLGGGASKIPKLVVVLGGMIVWLCLKAVIAYLKKQGYF